MNPYASQKKEGASTHASALSYFYVISYSLESG